MEKTTEGLLEIVVVDSSRVIADEAVEYIGENEFLFDEAIRFAIEGKYPVNMRAARVVEQSSRRNKDFAKMRLPLFVEAIKKTENDGVKRGFLKIIDRYVPGSIDEDLLGLVIDICFAMILSPSEPIAVKWYSILILDKIIKKEPDLIPEFKLTLEDQIDKNSAAMNRMIRKKLKELK